MQRRRSDQRVKSGHRKCKAEYRRFPRAFDYLGAENGQSPGFAHESPRSAHSTGLKTRPKATHRCWTDEVDCGLELRDAAGTLLARLESNAGRHRLTYPRAFPILSWAGLSEAKHRAESIALSNLPLVAGVNIEKADLARTNAANTKPNPMGPPLDQPWPIATGDAIASDWRPTGAGADMPDIPDFPRRAPCST
jgi:hypothetical protein